MMSVSTTNLEIFYHSFANERKKRLPEYVEAVRKRMPGYRSSNRPALRQSANLLAGGIMGLTALVNVNNDVSIHQYSHACFLRRYS